MLHRLFVFQKPTASKKGLQTKKWSRFPNTTPSSSKLLHLRHSWGLHFAANPVFWRKSPQLNQTRFFTSVARGFGQHSTCWPVHPAFFWNPVACNPLLDPSLAKVAMRGVLNGRKKGFKNVMKCPSALLPLVVYLLFCFLQKSRVLTVPIEHGSSCFSFPIFCEISNGYLICTKNGRDCASVKMIDKSWHGKQNNTFFFAVLTKFRDSKCKWHSEAVLLGNVFNNASLQMFFTNSTLLHIGDCTHLDNKPWNIYPVV